jgi:hypothetical protein
MNAETKCSVCSDLVFDSSPAYFGVESCSYTKYCNACTMALEEVLETTPKARITCGACGEKRALERHDANPEDEDKSRELKKGRLSTP